MTDAIQKLNQSERVYAYNFDGTRYDVGERLGYILTTLEFALQSEDLRYPVMDAMSEWLNKMGQTSLSS